MDETDLQRFDFHLPHGALLLLKLKPQIAVLNSIQQLQDNNLAVKKKAIFDLRGLLKDASFAQEFTKNNGVSILISIISEATGNTLAYALGALQEALYNHGYSLESLPQNFIQKISTLIDGANLNVCRSALEILALISGSGKQFKTVEAAFNATKNTDKLPFSNLVNLLVTPDVNIQSTALAVINNLLLSSDSQYTNFSLLLDKLSISQLLKKNSLSSDAEFKKQLFLFQKHKLLELKSSREISYNKSNPEHEDLLKKLWTLTYPNVKLDSRVSEQWKQLGFQGTDPATDFRGMGLLGLLNLIYFAETYTDIFRKIVVTQATRKEKDYPVAVAGINVSQMLCDLLHIDQRLNTEGSDVNTIVIYQVLFDHPKAFEELYCIVFKVLDSTWDEMNASYMDFPKVIAAVKKRVTEVLQTNPSSIEIFNKSVNLSHNARQQHDTVEEDEAVTDIESIAKLRNKIKVDIADTFKQQRLLALCEGSWFKVPTIPSQSKVKGKQDTFIYLKLADNKQDFITATSTSNTSPPDPNMTTTIKLTDISDLTVGSNTPMFSKQKKLSPQDEEIANLSFSLMLKVAGKSVDFTAFKNDDFLLFSDGVRLLLSDRLENKESYTEIKSLTNIDLRIKLLDLEGKTLPTNPPPIPKVCI